jgi:hypothetical protein
MRATNKGRQLRCTELDRGKTNRIRFRLAVTKSDFSTWHFFQVFFRSKISAIMLLRGVRRLSKFNKVFPAPLMLATAHRASETQNVPWAQCRNSQPMLLDLRVPTIQVTHLGLSWLLLPFSMSGQ